MGGTTNITFRPIAGWKVFIFIQRIGWSDPYLESKGGKRMKLQGAQVLIECLREQGVDTIFGYPGVRFLPI